MPVYLHSLALRNYRGIGPDWELMPDFKDFNFFVGANNAGKSTVLNFISKWLPLRSEKSPKLGPTEVYLDGTKGQPEVAIGCPTQTVIEAVTQAVNVPLHAEHRDSIIKVAKALEHRGTIWIKYSIPSSGTPSFLTPQGDPTFRTVLSDRQWNGLWNALTHKTGGSVTQHWILETVALFRPAASYSVPNTILIPAFRSIGPKDQDFAGFSGTGLIDRLAQMQSPDIDKRNERKLFDQINAFLQDVTGYSEAYIEIPHNRVHILVHIEGKTLPLWALGTGIHEVILIASYCTMNQNAIACIEEPELHLHPLLQRKLLAYLKQHTTNQYFIATHSAAFIDTPDAAIFHVRADASQTRIKETVLRSKRYEICQDLGYKASDIVQANSVIWCEGPSDRVYLNYWLKAVDQDLVEGVHYSIMFYGGRNLSHLTANDDEVNEFISLRALNQNSAIMIDSDRTSASEPINDTKKRICEEFRKGRGLAWVTAGREIENYLNFQKLHDAIRDVHPRSYSGPANSGGEFDRTLAFVATPRNGGPTEVETADKVKVAKVVTRAAPDLDVLDLRDRLTELLKMIRGANT